MDTATHTPQNLEERAVWYAITLTWAFYAVGALYLLAPALGWSLVFYACFKAFVTHENTHPRDRVRVPLTILIWILGMVMMEVALIAGHLNYDLGTAKMIKSSVGWAKGWALLAVFPFIGAALDFRPIILYRASCRLALQTLVLLPLFVIAPIIHLPGHLFTSPLSMLGGPGPEFFDVQLYGIGAGDGATRWRFWTPWAPAAGFVANIYFIFAMAEKDYRWKAAGIIAAIAMCFMSASRLALIAMIATAILTYGLSNLVRPLIATLSAAGALAGGILFTVIEEVIAQAKQRFVSARADSSRVRSALGRIALQRWQAEAKWFGHGVVEDGPHLVEYMPIGSHHTWFGLLFVKGLVGAAALGVPMIASTIELILKAQVSRTARSGLAVIIVIWLYTFGENLEILVYLFWPGLIIFGIAARQRFHNPFRKPLHGR